MEQLSESWSGTEMSLVNATDLPRQIPEAVPESITVTGYDDNYRVEHRISIDRASRVMEVTSIAGNSLAAIERYEYNTVGLCIKMEQLDKAGKVVNAREFSYDKKGDVVEEVWRTLDSSRKRILYTYTPDAKVSEETHYAVDANGKEEIDHIKSFSYTRSGDVSSECVTDKEGNIVKETRFSYDTEGSIVIEEVTDENGNTTKVTYHHKDNEVIVTASASDISYFVERRVYDEHGRLVLHEQLANENDLPRIVRRNFSYQ